LKTEMARRCTVLFCVLLVSACGMRLSPPGWRGEKAIWPEWRGGPTSSGYIPNGVNPPLKLKWKFRTESPISSSPVLRGGVLFIGCLNGRFYLLDEDSGRKIGSHKFKYGIEGTPAVSARFIFIPISHGSPSLVAFDMGDGRLSWKAELGDVSSSPKLSGGALFVGSRSGELVALRASNGERMWSYKVPGQIHSSLALGDEVLYFGSDDDNIYALGRSNGDLIWKSKLDGSIYSTPALWEGRLYVGSSSGSFYCIDSGSGEVVWTFRAEGGIYSSPAVAGGRVFFGSDDRNVYSLDAASGRLLWKAGTGGVVKSSPALTDSVLYIGSYDGILYAFDAGSGDLVWQYKSNGPIVSSPALTDKGVYVSSKDRSVYAFSRRGVR